MSHGIFIRTEVYGHEAVVRPKSKKAVKEAVKADPSKVALEDTSFGYGYNGPVSAAPNGRYDFVGPNPQTNRKFYGYIVVRDGAVKVL